MFVQKQCVGCGYCCITAMCSIGLHVFGKVGKCPALTWNGHRYICEIADLFVNALNIGKGCCAPLNTWRERVRERKEEGLYFHELHCTSILAHHMNERRFDGSS
jgi:hypothetical protein